MRNVNVNEPQNQQSCQTSVMVSADLINKIRNEDCLSTLQLLPNGSVDLLLQDTPFGCTQNDWDIKPDLPKMWIEWERVTKENGAMIFFATQPFASELILSNQKIFRYDLIWYKALGTGFLNANKMPMRNHEIILVFYQKQPTYNFQKRDVKKPFGKILDGVSSENYGNLKNKGERGVGYPKTIIEFPKPNNLSKSDLGGKHPTQKPVALMEYLIKTYTNEDELVLDFTMGSGTTGVACKNLNRNFIGIELDEKYFTIASERINKPKDTLF